MVGVWGMEAILAAAFTDRHTLERYAPAYILFQSITLAIGCYFWIASTLDAASFEPTTWGHFAWSLSAEFWAAVNMAASAICIIGLINPIRRSLVVIGGLMHIAEYIGLSYSAFYDGGDPAVGIYASALLMSLNIVMVGGAFVSWKQH